MGTMAAFPCQPVLSKAPAVQSGSVKAPLQAWGRPRRQHWRVATRATQAQRDVDKAVKTQPYTQSTELGASLRAEAEAPFRSLRVALFGAGTVSAGLATLFTLPQIAATLAHAPNAKSPAELGLDIAINLGALAFCGYFLRADLQARDKQIARLQREEKLGALKLELSNGKVLRLAQLRSFARVVMVAGTPSQVAAALAAAEPFRQQLQERGVFVVGLPIFPGGEGEEAPAGLAEDDLRWRATPVRLDEWAAWFKEQAALANAPLDRGLFIGLRLDGRVRASGTGCPPWQKFALQLPPTEGFFGGFFDGMDGRVPM